jgi:2-haloacid dehalogenase
MAQVAHGRRDGAVMDFGSFRVLTFDCYGTLVDWEPGVAAVLRPLLAEHGVMARERELLEAFGEFERSARVGLWVPFREVLSQVVERIGERFGIQVTASERDVLAQSIRFWPLFPDTRSVLQRLKRRYLLGVISNIDDDLFELTRPQLGVDLDLLVTAEQARACKPELAPFHLALERMGLPRREWLHVAQSVSHDIVPARKLGVPCVRITRRGTRFGEPPPEGVAADLELPDLNALVERVGVG